MEKVNLNVGNLKNICIKSILLLLEKLHQKFKSLEDPREM